MSIRCTYSTFRHASTGVGYGYITPSPTCQHAALLCLTMTLLYINNVYQGWGNVNTQRKYDKIHTPVTPQHDSACMWMQDDGLTYVGMRVHHKNIENSMKIRLLLHTVHTCKKHVILVKKYDYTSKIEEIVGINT